MECCVIIFDTFATAIVIQVQSIMRRLDLGFSQPECSALTTTLWDTRITLSLVTLISNPESNSLFFIVLPL